MTLRPLAEEDASRAFRLLHGREPVLRWLEWKGPESEAELSEHYSTWVVPGGDGVNYRLAIEERTSGEFVGDLSLRFGGHPGVGDVGYWLGEPYWGRGYMSEAVRLGAYLAFEHLSAQSLCAWVFHGNEASRVVLEKNGFTVVRPLVHKRDPDGEMRPQAYLALTASEWRGRMGGVAPDLRRRVELPCGLSRRVGPRCRGGEAPG